MERPGTWFDGDEPRDDFEASFLAGIRGYAAHWDSAGLTPACTATQAFMVPLYLQVNLPGIPSQLVNLQIGLWQDTVRGTGVQVEWGNSYLLDTGGPSALEFTAPSAEPQELAEVASQWLIEQLA